MSYESRLMDLLERGNPAIEVDERAWSDMDAASYLATLERRRSGMTQLETRIKNPTETRRRVTAVAAAFAVVIVTAVGLAVAGLNNGRATGPPTGAEVAGRSTVDDSDFVGRWRTNTDAVIQIDEDGTYRVELVSFARELIDRGTWRYDGVEFVWTTAENSPKCAGAIGRYQVTFGDDGSMTMSPIGEDPCIDRANSLGESALLPLASDAPSTNGG